MKRLISIVFAVIFAAFLPASAHAQVGATTDIIMGRVVGPQGEPIVGARVEVTSNETGIKRTKVTGSDGRYAILFPDGGGNYRVQVIAIGFTPARTNVTREGDEDRLEADVTLGKPATVLGTVQVRAGQRQRPGDRPEAGSTERGLPPVLVNRLPVDAGDLNALATLAAGVVGIAATDSTSASFSAAGQPADQNSLTLDGLSFGSGTLPQEAIRGTRVITNTYDVARGQFTGAQVATTTRGGTNFFQGALNYSLRDPSLEFAQEEQSTLSQKYTQNQINGGLGGPIIKDKFFVFGAAAFSRRTDPLQSLLVDNPLALQRIGTSSDSVQRFLAILNRYGLQPTSSLIPDQRLNDNASAIVRLDYTLSEANSLMLRGDWRGAIQDASRISAYAVPHNGGNTNSTGGGGMLTLSSHWGSVINELRAYSSVDNRAGDPYLMVPSGHVTVTSTLDDGTSAVSTLQFGVNTALPQVSQTRLTEASDEISLVSTGGDHRFKLGGLINQNSSANGSFANALGTYTFNSLAAFERDSATQFTRTLSATKRGARGMNSALYLGDSWRVTRRLQLTYGTRFEMSRYPDEPAYNPVVDSLFGLRTDRFPKDSRLTPRIGFSYAYGGASDHQTLGSIRGGIGAFRGTVGPRLFFSAGNATGLGNGQSQLFCVGSSVPQPDWSKFVADPGSAPETCNGASQQFGNQRRNVTVFAPDFTAPRALRSSLGFTRALGDRGSMSLDAAYSRGIAQTSAIDANLKPTPNFSLASEAGRPVFVPANLIVPTTGVAALGGSRLDPRLGVVSELTSRVQSDTRQLSASLSGGVSRALQYSLTYAFTKSRDQAGGVTGFGGTGAAATTAGNPNIAEWGTNDLQRRHSMFGTLLWTVRQGLEITALGRLSSGGTFTPLVFGDVNGDGMRNDRSFIFNPATAPDTAIANGMARLLKTAPDRARDCLQKQLGAIAARGSCSMPWTPALDLQANLKPSGLGLQRRLTVSIVASNALTAIDQLLHSKNLRGWGQPVYADRNLLYVKGFDPLSQRFLYQVNEHFGFANGSNSAYRVPFQLALQGRLTIGVDPARQQMAGVFGKGGGEGPSVEEFRTRLSRAVPNTFRQILDLNDSLKLALTPDQQAKLTVAGDSLQAKADTLIGALAEILGKSGKNSDPMALATKMRSTIQDGRKLSDKAITESQKILTRDQWAQLPKSVQEPLQARPVEGKEGREGREGRQDRE